MIQTKQVEIFGQNNLLVLSGSLKECFQDATDTPLYLGFSDGTLLKANYSRDRGWQIRSVHECSATRITRLESVGVPGKGISDRVTLEGDLHWVAIAHEYVNL